MPTVVTGYTTNSQATNATSHTVNTPTYAAGDKIYIAAILDDAGVSMAPPSGFAALTNCDNVDVSGAIACVWAKTAASEGASYTWTSNTAERSATIAWAVHEDSGIHAQGTNATGTSTTATVPAVTTSVADCLRIAVVFADYGNATIPHGTASGHTFLTEIGTASGGSVSVQYKALPSSGTDASQTVSLSASDGWVGITFAIAPTAAIAGENSFEHWQVGELPPVESGAGGPGGAMEYWQAGELPMMTFDTLAGSFSQSVGGTLTSGGGLVRSTSKLVAGTLTTAGAIVKAITKFFSGTLTSSGLPILGRTTYLVLAGTLTSSGGLVRRVGKAVAGTLTTAGALVTSYIVRGIPGPPLTLPPRSRAFTVMVRAALTVKERIRSFTLRDTDS